MICTWGAATHLGYGPEINQDRMYPRVREDLRNRW